MAISDTNRQSLIPNFLYSTHSTPAPGSLSDGRSSAALISTPMPPPRSTTRSFVIPSPTEKILMYSPAFYGACVAGGVLSCGLTHMAVTPLDLVKCNMQVPSCFVSGKAIGFSRFFNFEI